MKLKRGYTLDITSNKNLWVYGELRRDGKRVGGVIVYDDYFNISHDSQTNSYDTTEAAAYDVERLQELIKVADFLVGKYQEELIGYKFTCPLCSAKNNDNWPVTIDADDKPTWGGCQECWEATNHRLPSIAYEVLEVDKKELIADTGDPINCRNCHGVLDNLHSGFCNGCLSLYGALIKLPEQTNKAVLE